MSELAKRRGDVVNDFAVSRDAKTEQLRARQALPPMVRLPSPAASFGVRPTLVTTTSKQFLPANKARRYLFIQNNDSAALLYINYGNPAAVGAGIKLLPNGIAEYWWVVPSDSVNIIADTQTSNVIIVEAS